MAVESRSRLEARVKTCLAFNSQSYYNNIDTYLDFIVQVHSITQTEYGWVVLSGWRAEPFGPRDELKENKKWRLKPIMTRREVVSPKTVIKTAIEKLYNHYVMDISVWGDHRESLNGIKFGDFVALQNVRAVTKQFKEKTVYHLRMDSGSSDSGLSIVPKNFDNFEFQEFRIRCEEELLKIDASYKFVRGFFKLSHLVKVEVKGEGTQEITKEEDRREQKKDSLEARNHQEEAAQEPNSSLSVQIMRDMREIPETPEDSNTNDDGSLKEEGEDEQDTERIIVNVVKKNKKKKRRKEEEEEFVKVENEEREEECTAAEADGTKKKKRKKRKRKDEEEDFVNVDVEEKQEEECTADTVDIVKKKKKKKTKEKMEDVVNTEDEEKEEDGVKKKKKKKKRRKYEEEDFVKIEDEEKEKEDCIETATADIKKKEKKRKKEKGVVNTEDEDKVEEFVPVADDGVEKKNNY